MRQGELKVQKPPFSPGMVLGMSAMGAVFQLVSKHNISIPCLPGYGNNMAINGQGDMFRHKSAEKTQRGKMRGRQRVLEERRREKRGEAVRRLCLESLPISASRAPPPGAFASSPSLSAYPVQHTPTKPPGSLGDPLPESLRVPPEMLPARPCRTLPPRVCTCRCAACPQPMYAAPVAMFYVTQCYHPYSKYNTRA